MRRLAQQSRSLLRPLVQIGNGPPESIEQTKRRRDRVVSVLEELIVRDPPRRKTRAQAWRAPRLPGPWAVLGWGAGGATVAAAVLTLLLSRTPAAPEAPRSSLRVSDFSGTVTWRHAAGTPRRVRAGQTLAFDDQLTVGRGSQTSLILTSGARATVRESSVLAVAHTEQSQSAQRLVLRRGVVSLNVPPLPAGHTLSIATPHATATVIGTRFSVTVLDESSTHRGRTCVEVGEGQVRVAAHAGARAISAGESWSSDGVRCMQPNARPTSPQPPSAAGSSARGAEATMDAGALERRSAAFATTPNATKERAPGPPASARTANPRTVPATPRQNAGSAAAGLAAASAKRDPSQPPPTAAFSVSSLEQQNQLFAQALTARQAGHLPQAAMLFRQLLAQYPGSPLAEQARRELGGLESQLPSDGK